MEEEEEGVVRANENREDCYTTISAHSLFPTSAWPMAFQAILVHPTASVSSPSNRNFTIHRLNDDDDNDHADDDDGHDDNEDVWTWFKNKLLFTSHSLGPRRCFYLSPQITTVIYLGSLFDLSLFYSFPLVTFN